MLQLPDLHVLMVMLCKRAVPGFVLSFLSPELSSAWKKERPAPLHLKSFKRGAFYGLLTCFSNLPLMRCCWKGDPSFARNMRLTEANNTDIPKRNSYLFLRGMGETFCLQLQSIGKFSGDKRHCQESRAKVLPGQGFYGSPESLGDGRDKP